MIANKKERHKILRGAAEALRAVRGDFDAINAVEGMTVHFGCGCKICDIYLAPDADGFHRSAGRMIKCTKNG